MTKYCTTFALKLLYPWN